MNDIIFPEKLKYKYQVCAVIFGADKSILNIKLKDGYSFVLKSVYSKGDGLKELFQTDISGLQRNYYSAIVDDDYRVICIEKIIEIELNSKTTQEYWDKVNNDDLGLIDNQLRIIRLIKEGPIRCKSISFNLTPIEKVDGIIQPSSYYSLFPFSESYPTKNISTISCNDKDIYLLNNALEKLDFPLKDRLLNSVHIFYDLSYHTEFCVSVSLLMLCDSKEGLEDCSVYMRMFTEEQYVNQLEIADKLLESKNLYSYDLSLKIKQFSDRYSILVSKIKVLEMICNGEKASSEEIIEVIQMIINEADNVKNIYCSFKKMLEKETECIVRK